MTERRKFTTDFRLGDYVSIIRTEHGWYDGSLTARITHVEDYACTVLDEEDIPHQILKPRDIRKNAYPGVKIFLPGESKRKSKREKKKQRNREA